MMTTYIHTPFPPTILRHNPLFQTGNLTHTFIQHSILSRWSVSCTKQPAGGSTYHSERRREETLLGMWLFSCLTSLHFKIKLQLWHKLQRFICECCMDGRTHNVKNVAPYFITNSGVPCLSVNAVISHFKSAISWAGAVITSHNSSWISALYWEGNEAITSSQGRTSDRTLLVFWGQGGGVICVLISPGGNKTCVNYLCCLL